MTVRMHGHSFFNSEDSFNRQPHEIGTQATVSFWGERQIRTTQRGPQKAELVIPFYDFIEGLHEKIRKLSIEEHVTLSTKERIAGLNLLHTYRRFYVGAPRNINCITAIFLFIRDQWHKYTSRSSHALIEQNPDNMSWFRAYRENGKLVTASAESIRCLMPDYPN